MKECLWCKKEFKSKSERAKFCSTSHRVMWHRKFGGKDLNKEQAKSIYELITESLELMGKKIQTGDIIIPKKDGKMKSYGFDKSTSEKKDSSESKPYMNEAIRKKLGL